MGFRVKSALVQAKTEDGSYVHVYEGGFLPDNADAEQIKQLLDADMIEESDAPVADEVESPKRQTRKK